MGLITALGLAIGAVTIRSAKKKNLVPAAVVGKLFVAVFAMFFIETYALVDQIVYCAFNVRNVCCYSFCNGNNCSKIYSS